MIPKSGVRFSDKIMRKKEGGGAPKGACRPLSAPHNQMSPSESARARKRAKPGRARLPALRRGTRQTGRSRLTQLQNHVSWDGAEAGVLPASRLSSPAGSPQTGPSAGRVVSRSRPSADWQFRPRAPRPAPPFRHAFRKAIMRHLTGSTRPWNLLLGDHRPHRRILPCPTSSIFPFSCQMFERFLLEPTIGDCFWIRQPSCCQLFWP